MTPIREERGFKWHSHHRGRLGTCEGLPAIADDWNARFTQSPGCLGFPDVCTFRDLHFVITIHAVPPAISGEEPK